MLELDCCLISFGAAISFTKPLATILVVEREIALANAIKKGLQENGFEAFAYSDPNEALNDFRQRPAEYCVVLSDVKTPQMTGFQLAREVKTLNSNIKVIIMSPFEISKAEFQKVMPSTEIDDFLTKPATIAQVKNILLRHIGQTKRLKGSNGDG